MQKDIYQFSKEDLILRDYLATDRTLLANERTFLAYMRTAISIIVAGTSFIKLLDILVVRYIGYALLPLGFIIGIIGLVKYIKLGRVLAKIKTEKDSYLISQASSNPAIKGLDNN